MPLNECPKSKRACGHHCNHVWTHDACDWCGLEFSDENTAPTYRADHGFTPGKFSESCQVMMARYRCPYGQEDHDPKLPREDTDAFGRRRKTW